MKTKLSQIAAAALVTAVATAAQAGFVDKTLQATYYTPNLSTPYPFAPATPPVFTVGTAPATETTVEVEGVTQIAVDFTDTSVRFDFTTSLASPTWNTASFNGLVFDVLAGGPLSLAAASIDPSSTLGGFDIARVGWSDNQLTIDWNGLSYVNGTSLLVHFAAAPASVPEPGSWALLVLALAACGYTVTRKPATAGVKHQKSELPTLSA